MESRFQACNAPSEPVDVSQKRRLRVVAATCEGSHGPFDAAAFFTRPALGAPRRALLPGGDGEHQWSIQACSCFCFGGGLIGLQLRASTSTAFRKIRWIWCSRSASKGDQPAQVPLFAEPKARYHAVSPSPELALRILKSWIGQSKASLNRRLVRLEGMKGCPRFIG